MGIPFVVLTGASGSGKTTLAHAVKAAYPELAAKSSTRVRSRLQKVLSY